MSRLRNVLRKVDIFDFQELRALDWFLIAVLVGLALDWRLCYYLWKGIWLDEGVSILTSMMSILNDVISYQNLGSHNPALFEVLLHFTGKWFGWKLKNIRLLPIFLSTAGIYFNYRILRDLYGQGAGFLVGVLYTYQNYSLYLAHQIRNYVLLQLLATAALWAFIRWLREPADGRFRVLSWLSLVGVCYTHHFGLWIAIAQFSFLFSYPTQDINLRKKLSYLRDFALTYLPQAVLMLSVWGSGVESWAPRPDWSHFSYMITYWLNGTYEWMYYRSHEAQDWLTLSFIGLFLVATIRRYFKDGDFPSYLYMSYASLGVLVMHFILSQWRSAWLSMYTTPAAAGFLPLLVAVVYAYSGWIRWGLVAGLLFFFLCGATPYSLPDLSVDKAARALTQANPHNRYPILCYPDYLFFPIAYHAYPDILQECVQNTLSPFEKIRESADKKQIWLGTEEMRLPNWLAQSDTVILVLQGWESEFTQILAQSFEISKTPIYQQSHLPIITWAYRRKSGEIKSQAR
jgi:hypothetical protein